MEVYSFNVPVSNQSLMNILGVKLDLIIVSYINIFMIVNQE